MVMNVNVSLDTLVQLVLLILMIVPLIRVELMESAM